MSKLLIVGIVVFVLAICVVLGTLLSADKLDDFFNGIRRKELAEQHKVVEVHASKTIPQGTIVLRSMLQEEIVTNTDAHSNSARSLRDAQDRETTRTINAGEIVMEEDLMQRNRAATKAK